MAAAAQKTPGMDITVRILRAMRQKGIAGIPRNYELIYEAYAGTNPQLTRDINALGDTITQEQLDAIGKRHLAHHYGGTVVDQAHTRIVRELDGLFQLLSKEQSSLESYSRLLGETYGRIASKSAASTEILKSVVTILAEATGNTIAESRQIVASVEGCSGEMRQVREELDEYKKLANTDPLTRLSNRRAFDEVMSQLYDDPDDAGTYALFLADIDHFKKINDTYGHPVGDRVLSIVANVMRSSLRRDAFLARTGGEEFAVVLRANDSEIAMEIAERLRLAVESTPLRNQRTGTNYGPVTMSVGFCMASQASGPDELYRRVDLALYAAKTGGRNRCEQFRPELDAASQSNKLVYRRSIA